VICRLEISRKIKMENTITEVSVTQIQALIALEKMLISWDAIQHPIDDEVLIAKLKEVDEKYRLH